MNKLNEKTPRSSFLAESNISKINPTLNTVLFDYLYALLNFKHRKYDEFYEILFNLIFTLDSLGEIETNAKIVDENILKLIKKFITSNTILLINSQYDNLLSDRNIILLLTISKHTIKVTLILIMIFFTHSKKINFNDENMKYSKDDLISKLNNLLKKYLCNNDQRDDKFMFITEKENYCIVCSSTAVNNILNDDIIHTKTTNYKSNSMEINSEHNNFDKNKSISKYLPSDYDLNCNISEIKNSDLKVYISNVNKP